MPAYSSSRYAYEGTETTETSIVRVGGATDPAGQIQSRKIATTANVQWLRPFKAEPYAVWNATTGANVTATIYGVTSGSLPLSDEVWAEFEYLGSASTTLGTITTTTKSNVLATGAAVAADSSVWGGSSTTFDGLNLLVVLSNGNLTVLHNNTTNNAGAVSTDFRGSGKYYFEITLQGSVGSGIYAGVVHSSFTGTFFSSQMTGNSSCLSFGVSATDIWSNGATTVSIAGAPASGDIFSIAVDFDARLFWARKNGGNWNANASYDPATGVGGLTVAAGSFAPIARFGISAVSTDQVTGNFGGSSFAYTRPSGFSNWNTAPSTPFKLVATLSSPQPGQAGYIHARVRAAKASAIYYIDPQVYLS